MKVVASVFAACVVATSLLLSAISSPGLLTLLAIAANPVFSVLVALGLANSKIGGLFCVAFGLSANLAAVFALVRLIWLKTPGPSSDAGARRG